MSGNASIFAGVNIPVAQVVPLPADAAHNGVSIDGDGKVVLGNVEGDTLAELLDNREIPMRDFYLRLLQTAEYFKTLQLSAGNITADEMLTNEGNIITKVSFSTVYNGHTDFDPINDNFRIMFGTGGIE